MTCEALGKGQAVLQTKETANSKCISKRQKGCSDQSKDKENGKMRFKRQAGARTHTKILVHCKVWILIYM